MSATNMSQMMLDFAALVERRDSREPCVATMETLLNDAFDSFNTTEYNASICADGYNDELFGGFQSYHGSSPKPQILTTGKNFYAYFTPVILLVGLVGNSLSLAVFTTKSMWKLSASTYLAALSIADIATLVFYVFIEWLRRGLVHIDTDAKLHFLDKQGFCQVLLFMSYMSRCMSSWIIVVFTMERFTGVCYPLKVMKRNSKHILLAMLTLTALFVLYKPILSGEYTIRGRTACTANPDFSFLSFVLDSTFAVVISFIPFLIITSLNFLIVRTLFLRNYRRSELFAEDTKIRLEFTFILFAISFFFVAFNAPYFIIWFRNFLNSHFITSNPMRLVSSDVDRWNGILLITRTIFYMNYCVNFFLYSITGAYFRKELSTMLRCQGKQRNVFKSHIRHSRMSSTSTHMTSFPNDKSPQHCGSEGCATSSA